MLQEEGWGLGSVQSFDPDCDIICVQSLMALKTRAKDDKGKTYWVYPDVEFVDEFQRKNVLDIRPSMTVSKNKEKSIEALFTKIFEHVWNGTQKTIPFAHWVANWTRDDQKNSYLIDAIVSLNTICFRWNVYFVEVLFPVYHDKDYNVLQMNLKFVLSKYCNFINLMKW